MEECKEIVSKQGRFPIPNWKGGNNQRWKSKGKICNISFLRRETTSLKEVVFVLFDLRTYEYYRSALEEI
ncbi:MAG: hypothetical protein N2V75_13355 [Methanophagales archaeon]|nr:hypothetical protein [Methanophagales archaeon]